MWEKIRVGRKFFHNFFAARGKILFLVEYSPMPSNDSCDRSKQKIFPTTELKQLASHYVSPKRKKWHSAEDAGFWSVQLACNWTDNPAAFVTIHNASEQTKCLHPL